MRFGIFKRSGIGMSVKEATKINDPSKWKGQNLLGKALMKVREDLSLKD